MDKSFESDDESPMLPVLTFQDSTPKQDKDDTKNIACLKCTEIFKFPNEQDDYLGHLFLVHRLVIADVSDVASLDEYLQYWKVEFEQHELEQYCTTMLLDKLPDGTPAKNERYYLLSDIVPKDYEIRIKLKKERLEKALAQHQFELTDRSFSRECMYCRDVITGLRSTYLEHLFNKHFLQLGKPENLIYLDELLAKVQGNLENLVCLYCEKVFKDRITLKEHMRKKAHKRINPSNTSYDKYFLENYKFPDNLTLTRNQQKRHKNKTQEQQHQRTGQRRRFPSQSTAGSVDFEQRFSHKSDDSDLDWFDWNDDDDSIPPIHCLYCQKKCKDFSNFKQHLLQEHTMDYDEAVKGLNFYQKIKIVNYVRRQICLLRCVSCNQRFESQELLLQHLKEKQHFGIGTKKQWDKPEYFFSTYEDDGLLCISDDNRNDDDIDDAVVKIISEDPKFHINKDAEKLCLENFNLL